MAASSVWLVFARRRPESTGAGFRYLMVHLAGGAALFAGIILQYQQAGTMEIQPLAPSGGWASWLILAGVALNVALPPLHAWLPDAYPRATVTGAVYLSALTTKSAVCVLMKLFAGWEILLYGGVLMALYGVIYAVLANDIRQILAYHIISQVGYMVAGVGIGSALSLNGTAAHAFSHILYKALLFMGAGAVIQATGASKLTDLGGLRRHMRAVLWLFMVGAFSISGLPLLNGFISKSIIVSAAGDAHRPVAVLGLLLASVGTFLSIGLKIPAFAFWGPERRLRLRPIPANMYVAMGGAAVLCALYGVFPGLLYRILPNPMQYEPYTAYHLVESVQLLSFTFVGFWLLRGKLAGEPFIALDTDWFYRRSGTLLLRHIVAPIHESFVWGARSRDAVVDRIVRGFQNPMDWFAPWRGPRGAFDPDRERTPLAASLCFVLFFLVVLALIAIRS